MIHSEGFSEADIPKLQSKSEQLRQVHTLTFQNRGVGCKHQRFIKKAGRGCECKENPWCIAGFG